MSFLLTLSSVAVLPVARLAVDEDVGGGFAPERRHQYLGHRVDLV